MLKEAKDPRAQEFLKRLDPTRTTYDAAIQRRFRHFALQVLEGESRINYPGIPRDPSKHR